MDSAMKGEIEMDNQRQAEEDYLYHCNGCGKPDKNYPDKKTECEHCNGTGAGNDTFQDEPEECGACDGYGAYTDRVSPLEYHEWARNDAYGLFTGLYCEKCYDDPTKYTYRKDKYYDPAYAGERMDEDY